MKILVKSHRGGWTTSSEWVAEEYKNHLALKHRHAKRPPVKTRQVDLENSEPWMESPRSIKDLLWIAQQVQKRVDQYGPKHSVLHH